MVLLSFFSSIYLFICGILNTENLLVVWLFYPIGIYFAIVSLCQYFYILFAFERLEHWILDEEEKNARRLKITQEREIIRSKQEEYRDSKK